MNNDNRIGVLVTVAALAFLASSAAPIKADTGHCLYRQEAPIVREQHRVCHAPATQTRCEELVSKFKRQVEYQPGACPTEKIVGTCTVSGESIYFYSGRPEDVAAGCRYMGGSWRSADSLASAN